MRSSLMRLIHRELLIALRHRSELFNPLIFFVLVISLFPLALGGESNLLQQIAPAIIWVSAILANLLSLSRLFASDHQDGSLELLLLPPKASVIIVWAKLIAYWVSSLLPLIILTPVLALMLPIQGRALLILFFTLLLGTPTLACFGAIASALTLGLRHQGMLLALLVFPLYIPVLIFSTGAVQLAGQGFDVSGQLALLAAILILALALLPWASFAALKIGCE